MKVKPRLRGVSHEIACYLSIFAGAYLTRITRGMGDVRLGALIYSLSMFFLFAVSAVYHRPTWSPQARQRMRRLDHAGIYFLIAGTTTPLAVMALQGSARTTLLLVMWIGAALGVCKSLIWSHAPKALSALVYVLMGCAVIPFLPQIGLVIGPVANGLIIAGAVIYILGALVYAVRKPDPFPSVFGYHEIFHFMVIVASACHYLAILRVLRAVS